MDIDNGYLEGLCRGFKCGILKQADYLNLVQCETLEGKYRAPLDTNTPKTQFSHTPLGHMTSAITEACVCVYMHCC